MDGSRSDRTSTATYARVYAGVGASALAIGCLYIVALEASIRSRAGTHVRPLSAAPSRELTAALRGPILPFEQAVVAAIRARGFITLTVHVALVDARSSTAAPRFADGRDPSTNQCWGALYGVESQLAAGGVWKRAFMDAGDRPGILRRVVFQRRIQPGMRWRQRGIDQPFDLYLLASAWSSDYAQSALQQPLREALSGQRVGLTVADRALEFGSGSVLVGYVGPNPMIDRYQDPFAGLPPRPDHIQTGVFYICNRSAVYLYQGVVQRQLYPALFIREQIVPEGYVLTGLLDALSAGEFDDAFLTAAADEYALYQRIEDPDLAQSIFYR